MKRARLEHKKAADPPASQASFLKFTYVDFSVDSRDQREAATAAKAGFAVSVCTPEMETEPPADYVFHSRSRPPRSSNGLVRRFQILKQLLVTDPRHIARHRADCISCHDIWALLAGWLSTLHSRRDARPRLIYDAHEFELGRAGTARNRLYSDALRILEKFLINRSSATVVVNDSIADRLVADYRLRQRPAVVRNIPDFSPIDTHRQLLERERIRRELRIGAAPTICYHGVVSPGRGLEMSLAAVEAIEDVRLLIVGPVSASYRDELDALAQKLGIRDRVHFLDRVPQRELPYVIGAADLGLVLIEPISESYRLALPNKLFECIQSGLPVIASDLPEMSRIVSEWRNGELVDPADLTDIVDGIQILLKSVKSGSSRLHDACASAAANLNWRKEQTVLLAIFHGLKFGS